MRFDLRPLQGVGPIDFQMPRDDLRATLNTPFEEFMKTPDSQQPTDDFRKLDIHVYYDDRYRCSGVELWPGADLRVDGHEVLRRPWAEVRAWLTVLDPQLVLSDSLVKAASIGLSLYIPDLDEGPDAMIESAFVFQSWS